jgi:hypothetical protein
MSTADRSHHRESSEQDERGISEEQRDNTILNIMLYGSSYPWTVDELVREVQDEDAVGPERARQLINGHVRLTTGRPPDPAGLSRTAKAIRRAANLAQAQAHASEMLAAWRGGEDPERSQRHPVCVSGACEGSFALARPMLTVPPALPPAPTDLGVSKGRIGNCSVSCALASTVAVLAW